jgi:hypothetical protein
MADTRSTRRRRLSEAEIASYDHLDPRLARRVTVVRAPAIPGRYQGITLGTVVVLTTDEPADGTSALLAHELEHVGQWRRDGAVGFTRRYLEGFVRGLRTHRSWHTAYRSIPAEVDARAAASRWAERRFRSSESDDV